MKKFLCYISIILLVLLIALPPLTRIFYKEKEIEEVVRDTYTLLTCTKDLYIINESYKNNEPLSIKFTKPLEDNNINIEGSNIEAALDSEIKKLVNSTQDEERQEISYILQYQNFDLSTLSGLANFRLSLDNQVKYYEQNGYVCKKMIQ